MLFRSTAKQFADREIWDRARENARRHHFDTELVRKIADQGYLGAIIPREYGGAGLDYLSYGLVVEEIGRADSVMRTVVSVQTSLVCSAILLTRSRSKCSLRSFSLACSMISLSVNARAVSRMRRCSSLSSKSMAGTLPQPG